MGARSALAAIALSSILIGGAMFRTEAAGRVRTIAAMPPSKGAGSCAATACHGGVRPASGRIFKNEHTTWISRDRHAEAYQTLTGERSRSIARNLDPRGLPAHRDPRCLACHATASDPADEVENRDGVSCESCHGRADTWLTLHTLDSWPALTAAEKTRRGMLDAKDPVVLAKTCVGCHVGEPGREVDHDLIAAGHPRLAFELRAYLDQVPRHWKSAHPTEDSARIWAVGRATSALAVVRLLIHQADAATRAAAEGTPARWPEFAQQGCFSCHHELRDRPPPDRHGPGPIGAPRWATWDFPLPSGLIDAPSHEQHLIQLMSTYKPSPAEVSVAAKRLADHLEPMPARLRDDPSRAGKLDPGAIEPRSWDESVQRYLGLAAIDRAKGGDTKSETLAELRARLNFPKGYDSPKGFQLQKSR